MHRPLGQYYSWGMSTGTEFFLGNDPLAQESSLGMVHWDRSPPRVWSAGAAVLLGYGSLRQETSLLVYSHRDRNPPDGLFTLSGFFLGNDPSGQKSSLSVVY